MASVSCSASAAQVSYADHCSSILPESSLSDPPVLYNTFPLRAYQVGHYSADGRVLHHVSFENRDIYWDWLLFDTIHIYKTDAEGLFQIGIDLLLHLSNDHGAESFRWWSPHGELNLYLQGYKSFRLKGFWSELTGRLCMVGSVTQQWRNRNGMLDDAVVLKLYDIKNPATITSLIGGTIESISSTNGQIILSEFPCSLALNFI